MEQVQHCPSFILNYGVKLSKGWCQAVFVGSPWIERFGFFFLFSLRMQMAQNHASDPQSNGKLNWWER